MKLNLEEDEQILISSGNIVWVSDRGRKLDQLVLTNKGMYCCYKEKQGFFAKPEEMVYRFELSDIIKDEQASRIEQVKIKGERCMQIEFRHGAEHFSFQRAQKKSMENFFACFQQLLGVPDLTTVQRERNREMFTNLAGDVVEGMVEGVGTLLEAGSRAFYDKIEKMAEKGRSRTDEKRSGQTGSSRESEPQVYYLAIDGEPKGPFQPEQIAELALSGQINRETLAWTRGMDNWQPMDAVDGLRSVTENMPPVLK